MKKIKSKLMKALLTGTMLATSIGSFPLQAVYATGDDIEISSTNYYYQNLNTGSEESVQEYSLAKKFYRILEDMNLKGDFKDGVISYDLTNIISQEQLKSWVENGNLEVPKAFGAARDSFLMDHPELFYVDMYKIQLSAGYSGGTYKGFIDSGLESNIYRNDGFTSEEEVNEAIEKYDTAVEKIAEKAKASVSDSNPLYKRDAALAVAVNNEISKSVKYDFGLLEDWEANGDNAESIASLGHTGYGALVNKQAVCSGYSQAFKSVMDYLGVPCIIVSGYSKGLDKDGNDTDGNVGHAWNYVQLQTTPKGEDSSAWFAFDTTWNSVASGNMKYSLMDHATAAKRHNPQGAISSSGYELEYPVLSALSYADAVNTDMKDQELIVDKFSYKRIVKPFEEVFDVKEYISWEGKNAEELANANQVASVSLQDAQDSSPESMRIAMRYYYMYNGEKQWSKWQDLANSAPYDGMGIINKEGQTEVYIANNMLYTQYAVIKNLMPDEDIVVSDDFILKGIYYSDDALVSQNAVYISDKFENPVYGTYTAAPYLNIRKTTPSFQRDYNLPDSMRNTDGNPVMPDSKAILMKFVYDEPLHILDESQDIGVEMTVMHENVREYAGFVPFDDGKYVHLTKDENGVPNTLEFKFKPSLMYEHNREGYEFSFQNVGSAKIIDKRGENGQLVQGTSDKAPNTAYYVFSRDYIMCPCVFGDGRLWVDCCAQPILMDTSDLSIDGFKDENGDSLFSKSAMSQMMLVVNDVTTKTTDAMFDEMESNSDINISKEDILSSQTYDIKLQVCGKYKKIPDGSRVKIALGFPAGYGPKDEGVTFKLFHRKHISGNEYIIEEIPCVVTPFGIVATVESFSPYMVAAVDASAVTEHKVYATIEGNGGTLSETDNQIHILNDGESYTYDFTADEGYQIYSVTLNGKDILNKVVDGKLTVNYKDLESDNEIEVKYIANGAVQRVQENEIVTPVKVVVDGETNTIVGDVIEPSKDLEIHETWGKPTYEWTEDGTSCIAKRISDHNNEETVIATITHKLTKAPTCDTKGETTYTATFDVDWATEQTKVIVNIDAIGHKYVEVITKEATCIETGVKTLTCSHCQKSYTETIAKIAHEYSKEFKSDTTQHWKECVTCGNKRDISNHTFSWVIDKEATQTEAGFKHEECTVCGFAKDTVKIPTISEEKNPSIPDNVPDNSDDSSHGNVSSIVETSDASHIVLFTSLALMFAYVGYITHKRNRKVKR